MSFVDDALDYLETVAKPFVARRWKRRDPYVPRTLAGYSDVARAARDRRHFFRPKYRDTLQDTEVISIDHLIVLGRAGSGKSYLILKAYEWAIERFIDENGAAPLPLFIDCGSHDITPSRDLEHALRTKTGKHDLYDRVVDEHPWGIHLFIDEADTRIRRSPGFAAELDADLRAIDDRLPCKYVVCTRQPEWERFPTLPEIAKTGIEENGNNEEETDKEVVVYAFPREPIGGEYAHILPDADIRESFFTQCRERGYYDLLDLAFDGFGLARQYAETGTLPDSREELWDERVNMRLSVSEAAIEQRAAPARSRLRYLAGLLACLSFFSGRDTWSIRQAIDDLGSTWMTGHEQPVTTDEVRWLLGTRLFEYAGDDHYAFIHNRYRDVLAAEVLADLKPRKQRLLLLAAELNGRARVHPAYRGIAATLASISPSFQEPLIENEPEIAIFGSLPNLLPAARRDMLARLVEWAVREHQPPWREITGIGESLRDALARHRIPEEGDFLRPYLESDKLMERLWAATMAAQWGGVMEVNDVLQALATGEDEHTEVRKMALLALERSEDEDAIPTLETLLDSTYDEVRGYALRAWRKLEQPSPTAYIEKLSQPRAEPSLGGMLMLEVWRYPDTLDEDGLREAFEALAERDLVAGGTTEYHANLLPSLRQVLLERARELDFYNIPASLIVDYLNDHHVSRDKAEVVRDLLESSPALWEAVLEEGLAQDEMDLWGLTGWTTTVLGSSVPGDPDDALPDTTALSDAQTQFVGSIRTAAQRQQNQDGTSEANNVSFELEDESKLPATITPDEVRDRVRDVMRDCPKDPVACTRAVLEAIWRIYAQREPVFTVAYGHVQRLKAEQVEEVLGVLEDGEVNDVLDTLRNAFDAAPRSAVARPVARLFVHREHPLPAGAVSTFVKESLHWFDHDQSSLGIAALDLLNTIDRSEWQQVVQHLLSNDEDAVGDIVRYLIDKEESYFVDQAATMLQAGDYRGSSELDVLLQYIVAHEPNDLHDVLRTAHDVARTRRKNEEDRTDIEFHLRLSLWDVLRPLFYLMERGDEDAWNTLEHLLDQGEVPVAPRRVGHEVPLPAPKTEDHLRLFARWFAQIRHAGDGAGDDTDYRLLAQNVMDRIVSHGSRVAVGVVRDLQQSPDFEGAHWLSTRVLEVEDLYLSNQAVLRPPQQLLELILKDYFHLIQRDADLFELLCQVLDDINDAFRSGSGVAGFWEPVMHDEKGYCAPGERGRTYVQKPKSEDLCQNVLWALIQPRLKAYGVTQVEEDVVGPDYADLKIEYVERGRRAYCIFLELKVARKRYGPAKLLRPIEKQLWGKYLRRTGCRYGIYVVVWAKDAERHDWPAGYDEASDLAEALEEKAKEVMAEHDVTIATCVLDVSERPRSSGRS